MTCFVRKFVGCDFSKWQNRDSSFLLSSVQDFPLTSRENSSEKSHGQLNWIFCRQKKELFSIVFFILRSWIFLDISVASVAIGYYEKSDIKSIIAESSGKIYIEIICKLYIYRI